jgi:hypothetical protein
MISFLRRISFFFLLSLSLLACSGASNEKQEDEPMDSTTHFNDSTEAV